MRASNPRQSRLERKVSNETIRGMCMSSLDCTAPLHGCGGVHPGEDQMRLPDLRYLGLIYIRSGHYAAVPAPVVWCYFTRWARCREWALEREEGDQYFRGAWLQHPNRAVTGTIGTSFPDCHAVSRDEHLTHGPT